MLNCYAWETQFSQVFYNQTYTGFSVATERPLWCIYLSIIAISIIYLICLNLFHVRVKIGIISLTWETSCWTVFPVWSLYFMAYCRLVISINVLPLALTNWWLISPEAWIQRTETSLLKILPYLGMIFVSSSSNTLL